MNESKTKGRKIEQTPTPTFRHLRGQTQGNVGRYHLHFIANLCKKARRQHKLSKRQQMSCKKLFVVEYLLQVLVEENGLELSSTGAGFRLH